MKYYTILVNRSYWFFMLEFLMFFAYSANTGRNQAVSTGAPSPRYKYFDPREFEWTRKRNDTELAEETKRELSYKDEISNLELMLKREGDELSKIKEGYFKAFFDNLQHVNLEVDYPTGIPNKIEVFAIRPLGFGSFLNVGSLFFGCIDRFSKEQTEEKIAVLRKILKEQLLEQDGCTNWSSLQKKVNSDSLLRVSIKMPQAAKWGPPDEENVVILMPEKGSMCLRYFAFDPQSSSDESELIKKDVYNASVWGHVLDAFVKFGSSTSKSQKIDEKIYNTNILMLLNAMAEKDLARTSELVRQENLVEFLNKEELPSGFPGFEGITKLKAAINDIASSAPVA